jgi:hypothetical protein
LAGEVTPIDWHDVSLRQLATTKRLAQQHTSKVGSFEGNAEGTCLPDAALKLPYLGPWICDSGPGASFSLRAGVVAAKALITLT